MALAQKWKFETGNRKLVVSRTGASLNLNTNSVRKIYHKDVSNKCRLCGTHAENVPHIVSDCSMLAQKEYKRRHDKVCLNIHWVLCKKYGVKVCEMWYEHKVESVIENYIVKILGDVCIQVD